MSTENVVIRTPGRSDDEPEPYYSLEKTILEEMCEENSARIAILEEEIVELRRAVETQKKIKVETKEAACDAMAQIDGNVEMGNAVEQENIPPMQPARADQPLGPYRHGRQNASRRPSPYPAIMLCHFCNQRGFSDSCRNVIGAGQRAEIVKSKGLCPKCLKRHTAPCRKTFPCPYCGQSSAPPFSLFLCIRI
ncbi:hypothetical protein ANCCAN_28253 [Ancylostoma caninum]|uniref:Uncharacterized protein n=1 Tax=Ancylostoma caninum TaxID=29170 RepID=A0A368F764_ANCCA|nr:hypothetical protein ANCCAN_28253 [Ancylostoma caninum]